MLFARRDGALISISANDITVFFDAGYEIVRTALYTLSEEEIYSIAARSNSQQVQTFSVKPSLKVASISEVSATNKADAIDTERLELEPIPELLPIFTNTLTVQTEEG